MARPRGFPRGRSRRLTDWDQGPGSQVVTAITSTTAVILGAGIGPTLETLTIVRLRGALQAFLTSGDSINSGFHCALGIGVVTVDAFTVGGVASVPHPLDDMSWGGWLYHRIFDLHNATSTITDNLVNGLGVLSFEVDSKAMRKVRVNDLVFAVIQTVEDPASGMSIFFDSRILWKLA